MKGTAAALLTAMSQDVTTIAGCWIILRRDGTEYTFTDHQTDLVISGKTYLAAAGFSRTAIDQSAGLGVGNLDLIGVFDDASITESDIVAGFFRDAEVWYFEVDYTDTTIGTHKLGYGFIGEVRLVDNSYIAEFRDLTQRLDQEIGERTGRYCRVPLGSTQCGIVLEPDVWTATTSYAVGDQVRASVYDNRRYVCTTAGTSGGSEPAWDTDIDDTTADNTVVWTCAIAWTKEGTLSAVTSRRSFTAISLTDDWLNGGVFTFTSGANSGLSMDVKRNQVSGVVEVRHPFPFDPEIGDIFKVSTGCNHLLKMPGDVAGTAYTGDCLLKFNNARRFRGEPETPGPDRLLNQS